MQPLRKDHVDHYKDFVRDEFSLASNRVEREISQQAQDKVEEVGDKFATVIHKNLPSLIKDMAKKEKALRDFQNKKLSMEHDLRVEAQKIADQITEIFNNIKKRNKWDMQNINININDDNDAVDYITKKIKKACYEEAEVHARAQHKLYHALESKKKKCLNILYTGSHIQPTLVELQREMATANIQLDLPKSLLALPSK
jgi:Glu-tRNA(Gln) amidotransferase subunit E-like FAD-binding protein